jgi:rhodanese-related sulfurtransferase
MLSAQQLVDKAKVSVKEISVEQMNSNQFKHGILIDVREPEEFAHGNINDADNIPRGLLEWQISQNLKVKQLTHNSAEKKPIIVYCRSGSRSILAAQTLNQMGFEHVYSLSGGITAWQEAKQNLVDNPTTKPGSNKESDNND